MRDIKFQVKIEHIKSKKACVYLLTIDDLLDRNGCLYSPQVQRIVYKRQFTGVKDKNGKEIYEGDIIQYKSYYARKRWWSTTEEIPTIAEEVQKQRDDFNIDTATVVFKDGCFKIGYSLNFEDVARGEKFETGSNYNGDFESKTWDFEIIGNIHEDER